MNELIEIDGSILEGGGQILRIALTISTLKRIPIKIRNIRSNRSKPGLKEQHLKGLQLMGDLCSANVKGDFLNSTEIEFYPKELKGGKYKALVQTAGSISLLLQVALPCALFSQSDVELDLHGGTNAEMAPQIDYMVEVFRPLLEKFGSGFDFHLVRRGYFPKGGGQVIINTKPVQQLTGVDLTNFGNIKQIYGWSYVAGVIPISKAHQMADFAAKALKEMCPNVDIERYKEDRFVAPDNASGLILVCETDTGCLLGASAMGNRNDTSEETAQKALNDLLKDIEEESCLDHYCQDQVIILMALAKGPSKIQVGEVTLHTKTAIYVVEKLTKIKFEVIPNGKNNIIQCSGDQ